MNIERARDVNRRLTQAYFVYQGITDGPWPDVSDITAAEARACGEVVKAAEEAEHAALPPGAPRTMSLVIEAHRAPLYLAYAIAAKVQADEAAIEAARAVRAP